MRNTSRSPAIPFIAFLFAMLLTPDSVRFYFADEREPDGTPVYSNIDGQAHGEFYSQLAEDESQGPWLATFVKGQGYVDFHEAIPQSPGKLPTPPQ